MSLQADSKSVVLTRLEEQDDRYLILFERQLRNDYLTSVILSHRMVEISFQEGYMEYI